MIRIFALILIAAGASALWVLSAPEPLSPAAMDGLTGDTERGRIAFAAAGCASCHTAPDAASADAPVLAGGQAFVSDFGTFYAPNISSDPTHGIGGWSDYEIANAVLRGLSPDMAHYYPAFPYTSYIHMDLQDVADLTAYMRTLPADATPSRDHDVGFPFNVRRALGLWKQAFVTDDWVMDLPDDDTFGRGRYLVEGPGHCAECHTPRNALGALDRSAWMAGAPNPSGEGRIPNITPGALAWTQSDIAAYLQSGFTPDFDSAGGSMAHVIRNTAQLTDDDRRAIAAYLKALPSIPDEG